MIFLSRLLLRPAGGVPADLKAQVCGISREDFDDVVNLANLNHVIVRGM